MGLDVFLKELMETLGHSTIAYRKYLDGGKTFQFALELKSYNSQALKLLTHNKQLLTGDLQKDAESLIEHYTEWARKWELLATERTYQPTDVFVFANNVTFPRQAAQNIETVFKKLNNYQPIP